MVSDRLTPLLGPYEIVPQLGQGGMGVVSQALGARRPW